MASLKEKMKKHLESFTETASESGLSENALYLQQVFTRMLERHNAEIRALLERERSKCSKYTTVGGGTSEDIEVFGMKEADIAFVQISSFGASPVTIVDWVEADGKITVNFSADPSNDHVVNYSVTRCHKKKY